MGIDIISEVLRYISKRNIGKIGEYEMCEGGHVTLYASCFASMALHYLGAIDNLSEHQKEEFASYINSWQCPETGLFLGPEIQKDELKSPIHDYEHVTMHLTAHALPALSLLGGGPSHRLHFARKYLDKITLLNWLDQRDFKDAWLEGNNLLFIGQFLIHLRDVEGVEEASESLEQYFNWLDSHVDPKTGLWGTDGYCSPFVAMCGGYHQLLVYYFEEREVNYKEELIDTILALQHHDGGFNPHGGGGACEDVDAADILVNMYKRVEYRRADIRIALRKLLRLIWKVHMSDGGFVYRQGSDFTHMGIKKTYSPSNGSNMFATWFRVHTLALLAEVLTDEESLKRTFRFNNTCSMGWHSQWDKSELSITPFTRYLEKWMESKRVLRLFAGRLQKSLF